MTRVFAIIIAAWLASCASAPPAIVPSPAAHREVPAPVIGEADRAQAAARRFAETRHDLSSAELIRLLDLNDAVRRAARRVRSRRTPATLHAARAAIHALRDFMSKEKP